MSSLALRKKHPANATFSFIHCGRGVKGKITSPRAWGVIGALGVLASLYALTVGRMSASWLVINMATGVATVASLIIYHEPVTALKILAILEALTRPHTKIPRGYQSPEVVTKDGQRLSGVIKNDDNLSLQLVDIHEQLRLSVRDD
jgi:hypothetical protein